MASEGKKRENFFRITVLVVDRMKVALADMLIYYLDERQNKMSFEEFIDAHIEDIKYLKGSNVFKDMEFDKLIVGNKAKAGLKIDGLEVTLVRRLLDNLCPDLFMDDGCKTLQDFLTKNQHDIYHFFKFNERCCQCSQDYKFPVTSQLLQERQYKKMFKSSHCPNCAGKSGTVCSVSSCIVTIEYIKLEYNIRKEVFGHFSPIFKVMLKFTDIRDNVYGHADEVAIPNDLYDDYKQVIEENIMVLAKICGNEDETRLALIDVQKRSCDATLCHQYMNSLLEQVKRDMELKKAFDERMQKLEDKHEKQIQKLKEQIGNLKATETNLPKESSSTENDQTSQDDQSSMETDAEPYMSSVNNDLENKGDIYDGVVLHAEDDRDAAIEFIRNMERENPDLNIEITIYENLDLGTSAFESPAKLFDNCRYLFVFVTENFVKAEHEKFYSEIATFETLTFQKLKARLIPVKTGKTYHSPLGPVRPLRYDNYLEAKKKEKEPDRHFIECFAKLINNGRTKYLVN